MIWGIEAHLLGDPDELLRGDGSLDGVVPAAEGLDLLDLPRLPRPPMGWYIRLSSVPPSSSACVSRPPSMSQRRMLWSCSTEYSWTVLRCSLAMYMAMSARCSSTDTSSPCSGAMAMPALAVTEQGQAVHLDRARASRC